MKTKQLLNRIGKLLFLMTFFFGFAKSNAQCSQTVLTLYNQTDVDNFATVYGNVTNWDGEIRVGKERTASDITNLNGLHNLQSVCGLLFIGSNPMLTDLNGLDNLSLLGNLSITSNATLMSFHALRNLTSINGSLYVYNNDMLTNLTGLENLTSVTNLEIRNNDGLEDLSGLLNIRIAMAVTIWENINMTSLSGLNINNTALDGLYISLNSHLQNIDALQNLNFIGDVNISRNDGLTNLNGLKHLTSSENLVISNNPLIINADDLLSLTYVDYLSFHESNIMNVNGLMHLESVGYLEFDSCEHLENLSGLENVITLKSLHLGNLPLLNSIEALSNATISDYNPAEDEFQPEIIIATCPLLSQCAIQAICGKITDADFNIFIDANGIGCESVTAIETECQNLGIVVEDDLSNVRIFPNLAASLVTISRDDFSQVKIFDMMGKNVLDTKIESNSFNVENLPSGRYVAQLIGRNGKIVLQDLVVK